MTDDLDRPGPALVDVLNADPPPEHVEAVEIELLVFFGDVDDPPLRPFTFTFERDDGTRLIYARWLDPDTQQVVYRLRGSAPPAPA